MTDTPEGIDTPEGTRWRLVRVSDTLFRLMGAAGVEWGAPDSEGVYTPTVFIVPTESGKPSYLRHVRRGGFGALEDDPRIRPL